eukprot:scaffold23058_cov68-Phaeocystis_antarctica.AAC.12
MCTGARRNARDARTYQGSALYLKQYECVRQFSSSQAYGFRKNLRAARALAHTTPESPVFTKIRKNLTPEVYAVASVAAARTTSQAVPYPHTCLCTARRGRSRHRSKRAAHPRRRSGLLRSRRRLARRTGRGSGRARSRVGTGWAALGAASPR